MLSRYHFRSFKSQGVEHLPGVLSRIDTLAWKPTFAASLALQGSNHHNLKIHHKNPILVLI
jgi:hypothetical protein